MQTSEDYTDILRTAADVLGSASLEVWVMVGINAVQRLDAHREKASSFPRISTVLHKPSGGGVSQCMRTNTLQSRSLASCRETFFNIANSVAVDMQNVAELASTAPCAFQVRGKARRNSNKTASFVGAATS